MYVGGERSGGSLVQVLHAATYQSVFGVKGFVAGIINIFLYHSTIFAYNLKKMGLQWIKATY